MPKKGRIVPSINRKWCHFFLILALNISNLSAQELTFVTINVWSGLDYKGTLKMGEYETRRVRQARYRLLLEELEARNPDVIALNEANPLPGYARRLARDLNYDYIYSVGMSGIKIGCLGIPVNFKEGEAILVRKSLGLKKTGVKRLSPGSGYIGNFVSFHFAESNQAIAGRIAVEGKPVYVVNTHLHAGLPDEERWLIEMGQIRDSGAITQEEYHALIATWRQSVARRQSETRHLLQWLEEALPPGAPIVLMGDFNALPSSEEIAWVMAKGFTDSYLHHQGPDEPGYTWDPKVNTNIAAFYEMPEPAARVPWFEWLIAANTQFQKRVDYIFVKNIPKGYIRSSELVFDQAPEGQHPSDHFGVLTRIRFESDQLNASSE